MNPVNPANHANEFEPVQRAYLAVALVSLTTATSWMALRPGVFLQYFYFSELFSLTHLVTLGFVTSLMMGVLLRLAPMTLGVSPRSRRWAWLQFVLFVVGASGMVYHFGVAGWSGMAWATLLVWLAAAIQIWNFQRLFSRSMLSRPMGAYIAAGILYLFLAASMGGLLGFQKLGLRLPFRELTILDRLSLHIHLALVGWVANLIIGFQLKLVPSSKSKSLHTQWIRFGLLQMGLMGLVISLVFSLPLKTLFAAILTATFIWQLSGPLALWLTGRFREWETLPSLLAVIAALIGLMLVAGWPAGPEDIAQTELRGRLQLAYVYIALMGYVAGTIIVTAFKLVPMWVWKKRFASEFGTKPVPGMKQLQSVPLTWISNIVFPLAVMATAVGVVFDSHRVVASSLALQNVAALCFVANFVLVARWQILPGLQYKPSEEEWARFHEMFPESAETS